MSNSKENEIQLVGMDQCIRIVFPDSDSRPSKRTFHSWKAKGYLPYHKIGKRVFLDPVQVREALDRQFLIHEREL